MYREVCDIIVLCVTAGSNLIIHQKGMGMGDMQLMGSITVKLVIP
jgi:hypothetical protein